MSSRWMAAFSVLGLAAWAVVSGPAVASAAAVAAAPRRVCRAEVVRPERSERSARFVAWLRAHPDAVPADSLRELLADPASTAAVLIADVENDGKDDYVITTSEGSGHFLRLWVFRPEGEGWERRQAPDELHDLAHSFFDPLAEEESLVVRFCGHTYVTLEGGPSVNGWREAFRWEGGAANPVCDAAWLAEQRRLFQQLFDRRHFDEAYGFLNGAQAACQPPPDRSLWLWMESDLALTAYRMGTYRSCREHVAAARRSPGFASAAPVLRQALAANDSRCARALSKAPAARYDFSWLRELARDPDQQFTVDRRFNGLLSAAVPDVKLDDGEALRDVLELRLILPQGIELHGDRYVVLAGCMPHNCEEKGLIWVDLAAQRSIVLTEASFYDPSAAGSSRFHTVLALGSTTIAAPDVPRQFWEQAARLRPGTAVRYAGPHGTWQELEVPAREKDNP